MHGKNFEKSSTFSVFFNIDTDSNTIEDGDNSIDEFKDKQEENETIDNSEIVNLTNNEIAYKNNFSINRDVLKYALQKVKLNNSFRTWDLTEWLIENSYLVRNSASHDKQVRPSHKINKRLKPVSRLLENFEVLGIVNSTTVQSRRGQYDTKEYRFTHSGYFIALLLEKDETNNESLTDEIYNFLHSSYEKLSTSYSRFWQIFITECKEKGYLDKYINHHIQHLKENSHLFQNVSQYLHNVNYYIPFEKDIFWSLLLETFAELDEDDYELFLYDLKIRIEDMQLSKVKVYANYEKKRFQIKEEFEKVVLEGYCNNCELYRSIPVDLLVYLKYQINSRIHEVKCDNCNFGKLDFDKTLSLVIPI